MCELQLPDKAIDHRKGFLPLDQIRVVLLSATGYLV